MLALVATACPAVSVWVSSRVMPSKNLTVSPASVLSAPGATAESVAVKTTPWPTAEGLGIEESAIAVASLPTIWFKAADVLAAKLPFAA